MNVRLVAFWLMDAVRGAPVRSHLRDIRTSMTDEQHARQRQSDAVARLIQHATTRVPFYARLSEATRLDQFPIINKQTLRDHASDMLAQGIIAEKLHVASTSGSTGTPLLVLHDRNKRHRAQAEVIYWGETAGYRFGERLFHLKVWSGRNQLSKFMRWLRNIVPVDVLSTEADDLLEIVAKTSGLKKVHILAYSSTLEHLARAIVAAPGRLPRHHVGSVIGQSEALDPQAREMLAQSFNCGVFNRYGLEEVGIVGQQIPGSGEQYKLNPTSHFVEVLREDSDTAAAPGEVGRIVVTDLVNYAQPIIRYDTGDLGTFALRTDGSLDPFWLAQVSGRKADRIYDVADRPITSLIMYKIWWRYPEVRQYQLVQTARGRYTLRLNTEGSFSREVEISEELRNYLGRTAEVAIEITNDSFELSSGKRRSVVSHYRPGPVEGDLKK